MRQAFVPLRPKDLRRSRPVVFPHSSGEGKTVTRIIPTGPAVERTQHQIAEYQRFRTLVRELVALGDLELARAYHHCPH